MASPFGFSKGSYLVYAEGSYFNTLKNLDDSGSQSPLPTGNQFTEYRLNSRAGYDFSDRFGVYADVNYKYEDATTVPLERINSGFSDVGIGADYLLFSGAINIIPAGYFSLPLFPTPGSDNTVLLGDGGYVATAKIYFSKNFSNLSLAAYGGVSYRGNGLDNQIPWGLLGELTGSSLFLDFQMNMINSTTSDSYSGFPQGRKQVTDKYDGGSLIYDAVNPQSATAAIRVGLRLTTDIFVSAGAEQPLIGQRIAFGTRFLAGIGFSDFQFGGKAKTDSNIEFLPKEEIDDLKKFNVDTNEEDLTLNPEPEPSKKKNPPKKQP